MYYCETEESLRRPGGPHDDFLPSTATPAAVCAAAGRAAGSRVGIAEQVPYGVVGHGVVDPAPGVLRGGIPGVDVVVRRLAAGVVSLVAEANAATAAGDCCKPHTSRVDIGRG